MGRNKKLVNEKSVRMCCTVSPKQREMASRITQLTGITFSQLVQDAIEKKFKSLERKHGSVIANGLPDEKQITLDDVIAGFTAKTNE